MCVRERGGGQGESIHVCLVDHAVYLQRRTGEGVRTASGPGTLGVRPLTGSVAKAECCRRLRAKTSVAHAAACPTGERPPHVSRGCPGLFGTDGGLEGGGRGPWWTDDLGERHSLHPPESYGSSTPTRSQDD